MLQGVPQGGVLSPILFNLYMAKMPQPAGDILLVTYADDTTVNKSGPKHEPICKELNAYLDVLDKWFKERNLFISPTKSSATIFTTYPKEVGLDLPIYINNQKVPTVKQPKILGVTYDNLFTFTYHAKNVKSRVQSRNNVLKALAGTSWGKEKEVLLSTYKAIGQSIYNYCSPIWSPTVEESTWKDLQVAQNSCLRTALGCVKMTSVDHLHTESKIMPVKDHCQMLSKQFLLATQKVNHPNYDNHHHDPPRLMKKSLTSEHGDYIYNLTNGIHDETNHKSLLKRIHTESVSATIALESPNPILGHKPPEIDKSERDLPRITRSTLSQLRSGYSSKLNSYLARIRDDVQNSCPDCNAHPHTTEHLFDCPAKPTELTTRDLWTNPKEAAQFLGLDGQENDDNG